MKTIYIAYLIFAAIISSIVTRFIITYFLKMYEPFTSIPGVPDILNHLSIDNSNVDRDDTDSSKRVLLPAFVISNLSNGLSIKKMIGVHNMGQNRNGIRITNGQDAMNSPCWGIDYADSTLLLRHYAQGAHPNIFTTPEQYTEYYTRWNWFLRIYPSTTSRYSYPPITSGI